jgi:hypothetical protein
LYYEIEPGNWADTRYYPAAIAAQHQVVVATELPEMNESGSVLLPCRNGVAPGSKKLQHGGKEPPEELGKLVSW